MDNKGLLMINTGNGKGKTTSALGLALRSLGHQLPVCMIQFIKGSWDYGELKSSERFKDILDYFVVGHGFTWKTDNIEEDKKAARDGWELAKSVISEAKHHLIILDELTYALNYGMIDITEAVFVFKHKPEDMHIMITGRNAPSEIIEIADLVTEMKEIRHPYKSGIEAQKGIEW
ncbi:MAG: cob(I)yrinic acid a,c-diamide adenosyltransferase [Spirochaetes bacterium]|nr:cob(I)yrinic acid a,c-diamide adenosyltransferase [Spirochaetota bacterium]